MSISFDAFGPVAYPLLACSFISLMLLVERLIFFMMWKSDGDIKQIMALVRSLDKSVTPTEALYGQNRLLKGTRLLLHHAQKPRLLREEIINHWLTLARNQLFKHFGWLVLLAVISPMLGLLGTVLGIINVFTSIASHTGPVHPALLANGLGQAMLTTAAGLIIATPVLVVLHSLRIWANGRLASLAEALNEVNLLLDGIDLQSPTLTTPSKKNKDAQMMT